MGFVDLILVKYDIKPLGNRSRCFGIISIFECLLAFDGVLTSHDNKQSAIFTRYKLLVFFTVLKLMQNGF